MKAFAMKKIGEVGWIEKDYPTCGPLDAIVRPLAVAPCTSDVHTAWEGGVGERFDMVLGHEACGEIVEVGSLVKDFKVGDKILCNAITPDWSSVNAQRGFAMHSGEALGGWKFSNYKDGVFSEYFLVNDADGNLAHMPETMSYEEAVMLCDMIPTGLHASELADVQFGDTVAVIGLGPVGLMAVAGAALKGAGRLIAVDARPDVYEVAKGYGATDIVDYSVAPTTEQIMDLTEGKGCDRVLVAGGDNHILETAVEILKPGGVVGNVNYFGSGDKITLSRVGWNVGMGHKTIKGGLMPGGRHQLERLSSLIVNKRLDVSPVISHRFKGFDAIEDAMMIMKEKPAGLIKPVVVIEE